jgi:hypothetical protein
MTTDQERKFYDLTQQMDENLDARLDLGTTIGVLIGARRLFMAARSAAGRTQVDTNAIMLSFDILHHDLSAAVRDLSDDWDQMNETRHNLMKGN